MALHDHSTPAEKAERHARRTAYKEAVTKLKQDNLTPTERAQHVQTIEDYDAWINKTSPVGKWAAVNTSTGKHHLPEGDVQ